MENLGLTIEELEEEVRTLKSELDYQRNENMAQGRQIISYKKQIKELEKKNSRGAGRKNIPKETLLQIKVLHQDGVDVRTIAGMFDISKATVYSIINRTDIVGAVEDEEPFKSSGTSDCSIDEPINLSHKEDSPFELF